MGVQLSKRSRQTNNGQFDLFGSSAPTLLPAARHDVVVSPPPASPPVAENSFATSGRVGSHKVERVHDSSTRNAASRRLGPRLPEIRTITEADVPVYSDTEMALVDASLKVVSPEKAWFTYADVRAVFTISRATIVRRLRSGVVPGVRFQGERMLDDGAIRRLTREQVRYLLLAMRCSSKPF